MLCGGVSVVMPSHSRSKNGVASLAYGAGYPALAGTVRPLSGMAGTSPAMTPYDSVQ